jgi:hypothetical protein
VRTIGKKGMQNIIFYGKRDGAFCRSIYEFCAALNSIDDPKYGFGSFSLDGLLIAGPVDPAFVRNPLMDNLWEMDGQGGDAQLL